jgi:hypothetical protein
VEKYFFVDILLELKNGIEQNFVHKGVISNTEKQQILKKENTYRV